MTERTRLAIPSALLTLVLLRGLHARSYNLSRSMWLDESRVAYPILSIEGCLVAVMLLGFPVVTLRAAFPRYLTSGPLEDAEGALRFLAAVVQEEDLLYGHESTRELFRRQLRNHGCEPEPGPVFRGVEIEIFRCAETQ